MGTKKTKYNKAGIERLPNNKPAVYKILTASGNVNYAGVAKRGRIQERIGEHLGDIPGATVQIQQTETIAEARKKEERDAYLMAIDGSENPFTPTFPFGGRLTAEAEIEGGETVQFPNSNMDRPYGPSHAEGGIDIKAPEDTRIFSDRLEYEPGVTYAAKADAIRKEIEKYKKLL